MTTLVLLLTTLPIILICLLLQKRKAAAKALVPPGPPGLPLIGNLHQFRAAKYKHIYLSQLSKKYGPLMHFKLGRIPLLVVTSARLAKEVLKTQDSAFCSRTKFIGSYKFAYNGLDVAFSPYSEYWREVKKILSVHHFSAKKIKSYCASREDEISRLVAKISSSSSAAAAATAVNLSAISLDHISSLTFRITSSKQYEESRFDELLHEAFGTMSAFYISDYFPSFRWVDKFTGLMKRLDTAFDKLDAFYQDLIDEHLDPNRVSRSVEVKEDILDVLIQMKQEQKSSSIDVNSWDNIKALLKNVFLGGTDTSAASIVWIMTSLIKAPEAMEKVQGEIRNLVGQKGRVDEDDLPNLPYLKAVIKEAFRLYPPFPLLVARETIDRCTLDGYEIQPRTVVYVNAWAIARDPENWENPDEFQPERFLNSDIDIKGQDFRVLPFGSGRRICPGMLLGLANVELTVANLLYSFDWELPPGVQADDIDTVALPGLTMHKKNPLLLVPKKYVI